MSLSVSTNSSFRFFSDMRQLLNGNAFAALQHEAVSEVPKWACSPPRGRAKGERRLKRRVSWTPEECHGLEKSYSMTRKLSRRPSKCWTCRADAAELIRNNLSSSR